MRITPLAGLPEVLEIQLDTMDDDRGRLIEAWRDDRAHEIAPGLHFVQDNVSRSLPGTIRALHYQYPHPQAKLVTVMSGVVFDVAVDVRRGSPRFGEWAAVTLSGLDGKQLIVPAGFAHGFAVIEGPAVVHYKCSAPFVPPAAHTILWNDPEIGVRWPIEPVHMSSRDATARRLSEIPVDTLPPM
jgi:dTDP-4-dehydrorhamnose 3,5-epimerase